jgi:hypothetical protein
MWNDSAMRGRVLKWGGGLVVVVTAAWMGIYFAEVGLNAASQVAGVVSAFIGLAGLVVAVYGMVAVKPDPKKTGSPPGPGAGDVVTNAVSGTTNHGLIIQGGRIGPADSQANPPAGDR